MPELNYLAVLAATAVAFVIGGLWYSSLLFGTTYQKLLGPSVEGTTGSPPGGAIWRIA